MTCYFSEKMSQKIPYSEMIPLKRVLVPKGHAPGITESLWTVFARRNYDRRVTGL